MDLAGCTTTQTDLFEEICKQCDVNDRGQISLESLLHFVKEEMEVSFVDSQSLIERLIGSLQHKSQNGWIAFDDICRIFVTWMKQQSSNLQFKITKPNPLSSRSLRLGGISSELLMRSSPNPARHYFRHACAGDGGGRCSDVKKENDTDSRDEELKKRYKQKLETLENMLLLSNESNSTLENEIQNLKTVSNKHKEMRKYYKQNLETLENMFLQSEKSNSLLQNEIKSLRTTSNNLKIKESCWNKEEILLKEREQQLTMLNNVLNEEKNTLDKEVYRLRRQVSHWKSEHEALLAQYYVLEEKNSKITGEKRNLEKILRETKSSLRQAEVDLSAKNLVIEEKEETLHLVQLKNEELQEIILSLEKHRSSRVNSILALTQESPGSAPLDNYVNRLNDDLSQLTSLHDELVSCGSNASVKPCRNISVQTVDLAAAVNVSTQANYSLVCENVSAQSNYLMNCKNVLSLTTTLPTYDIATQTSNLITSVDVCTQTTLVLSTSYTEAREHKYCLKQRNTTIEYEGKSDHCSLPYMKYSDNAQNNNVTIRNKIASETQNLKEIVPKKAKKNISCSTPMTKSLDNTSKVERSNFSISNSERMTTKTLTEDAGAQTSENKDIFSVPSGNVKKNYSYLSTYEMALIVMADASTQVNHCGGGNENASHTGKNTCGTYENQHRLLNALQLNNPETYAIQELPGHFKQNDGLSENIFSSTGSFKSTDTSIQHQFNDGSYLEKEIGVKNITHLNQSTSDISYLKRNVRKRIVQQKSKTRLSRLKNGISGLFQRPMKLLISLGVFSFMWWFFFVILEPPKGNKYCTIPLSIDRLKEVLIPKLKHEYPNEPPSV